MQRRLEMKMWKSQLLQKSAWLQQQQLTGMRLMTCLLRSALIDQAPVHLSLSLQMPWVRRDAHDSSLCTNGGQFCLWHLQTCDVH